MERGRERGERKGGREGEREDTSTLKYFFNMTLIQI